VSDLSVPTVIPYLSDRKLMFGKCDVFIIPSPAFDLHSLFMFATYYRKGLRLDMTANYLNYTLCLEAASYAHYGPLHACEFGEILFCVAVIAGVFVNFRTRIQKKWKSVPMHANLKVSFESSLFRWPVNTKALLFLKEVSLYAVRHQIVSNGF
jgi:hypothetical protein